jgi:hypothetical protein
MVVSQSLEAWEDLALKSIALMVLHPHLASIRDIGEGNSFGTCETNRPKQPRNFYRMLRAR